MHTKWHWEHPHNMRDVICVSILAVNETQKCWLILGVDTCGVNTCDYAANTTAYIWLPNNVCPWFFHCLAIQLLHWPCCWSRNIPSRPSRPDISTRNTVRCRYNAVNFLQNNHNRHPIARPWGRDMGCLLWVQALIYILSQSLHYCVHYDIIFDRVITALHCIDYIRLVDHCLL